MTENKRKKHVWGKPLCVRAKRHRDFTGEEHPCYWCGYAMPIGESTLDCDKCDGVFCPKCGKCLCNVTDEEFEALRVLRHKYCCNSFHFKKGLEESDRKLLVIVPFFEISLNYCRRQEVGVKR